MNNGKIKIVALFGKGGSGKDTLQKSLVEGIPEDFHGIVSCTTRPKRDYEQDGIDYHFISNGEFTNQVLNGEMLEATQFNNWWYGTQASALDEEKINVGVFNLEGISCLRQDPRLDILPVYIMADDKTRILRYLNRENKTDIKEMCRRFLADEKDFADIPFFSLVYHNYDKRLPADLYDLLKSTNFTELFNLF